MFWRGWRSENMTEREKISRLVWKTRLTYLPGITGRAERRSEWYITPMHDGSINQPGLCNNKSLIELATDVAGYDSLNGKRAVKIKSSSRKRIIIKNAFGKEGVIGYQEFRKLSNHELHEFKAAYDGGFQHMESLQ